MPRNLHTEAGRRAHNEYGKRYIAEQRRHRIAAGQCVQCGEVAIPGRRSCADHLAKQAEYQRKLRSSHKSSGLCSYCGRQPETDGRVLCDSCCYQTRVANRKANSYNNLYGKRLPIIERDHHKCRLCERADDLLVHHIDSMGLRSTQPNNNDNNLVTLCKGCHFHITRLTTVVKDIDLACSLLRREYFQS